MEDQLFNESLQAALGEPEIAAALETLAGDDDPQQVRDELAAAAVLNRPDIEAAARDELALLGHERTALDEALAPAVEEAIRGNPDWTESIARLRALAEGNLPPTGPARRLVTGRRPHDDSVVDQLEAEMREAPDALRSAGARARAQGAIDLITAAARRSVLARPSDVPRVADALRRIESAEAAARRSLLERGVLPFCRGWINHRLRDRLEQRLSLELAASRAPGLAELPNPDHEVPTPDGDHLVRLVGQLPGGSIGLSGPRGSGKTTLLRSFHQGRRRIAGRAPGLTAMVSAPVEYSPRDFVLHLFERVCLATGVERSAGRSAALAGGSGASWLRSVAATSLVLAGVGAVAAAIGGFLVFEEADWARLDSTEQLTLLLAGFTAAGVLLWPRASSAGRGIAGALAAALVGTTAVAVFVDEGPGWPGWLWIALGCVWIGAHVIVAAIRSRSVVSGPTARMYALVAVAEGAAIALAGVLGLDIGDRAVTGGVVLIGGAAALLATTAFDPLLRAPYGLDSSYRSLTAALFAAGAFAQSMGLSLLAFDLHASDRLLLGIALLGGGLWWMGLARHHRDIATSLEHQGVQVPLAIERIAPTGDQRAPVLEQLEDVLAKERAERPDAGPLGLDDALSLLRTWRVSGGELDRESLSDALWTVLHGEWGDKVQLDAAVRMANDELARRDQRRESWRAEAADVLHQIRYQQTFSATWSGKVGIARPLAVEASRGGGHSAAEVPMTLPQIVTSLQDFLRLASAVEPVVIAIDELDKMSSPDAAERFLNEVKAIFGVANCYFLISVSEDAVASFERRGLPFRDVVDSSFDEVLRVGYLSLADAEALLAKRVVLLPKPFAALCHALSGGLARDLIRTTRALFDQRELSGEAAMADLAPELVRSELKSKRDGTVTVIRGLATTQDVSPVLCWLASVPIDDLSLASIGEHPAPLGGAEAAVVRLVREFVGFWYFCITLVDVFTHRLSFDVLDDVAVGPESERDLGAFARARQSFVVDPQLAWAQISEIREAWSLDAVEHNGAGVIQRTV